MTYCSRTLEVSQAQTFCKINPLSPLKPQTVARLICTLIQTLSMTLCFEGSGNYVMKYFTKTMKG